MYAEEYHRVPSLFRQVPDAKAALFCQYVIYWRKNVIWQLCRNFIPV